MGHEDECGCDECGDDDFYDDADAKVDALINLLIKKKIITEDEINKEYDALFEDEEEKKE